MNGFLILIEGPDGTGKSTLINNLTDYLKGNGVPVSNYKDPGSTPLGTRLRSMLKGEDDGQKITLRSSITRPLLFTAVRAELTMQIRDDLAAGMVVLCDRYFMSTLVYQCGNGGLSDAHNKIIIELAQDPEVVQTPDTIIALVPITKEMAHVTHARAFNPNGTKDIFDGMPFEKYWNICQGYIAETERCKKVGMTTLLISELTTGHLYLFMNVVRQLEKGAFGSWFAGVQRPPSTSDGK